MIIYCTTYIHAKLRSVSVELLLLELLQTHHAVVLALACQQLLVRPHLHQPAAAQHSNVVGIANGGQPAKVIERERGGRGEHYIGLLTPKKQKVFIQSDG